MVYYGYTSLHLNSTSNLYIQIFIYLSISRLVWRHPWVFLKRAGIRSVSRTRLTRRVIETVIQLRAGRRIRRNQSKRIIRSRKESYTGGWKYTERIDRAQQFLFN